MDTKGYFKNKKIVIMGLGVLGRGVNVARFLAQNGANLLVTDLKTKEELSSALEELKDFPNIKYVLGEHWLEDFREADMVVRAANVPLGSPYLEEAQAHNIPVKMDASLFCELLPDGVKTIGITGTRGKSTVTQLVYEILKASGKRAWLGGNVRGVATLPLLESVEPGDFVVLELDSWQLQGFGDSKVGPDIAVFTTFMRDHQNYYGGDPDSTNFDYGAGMERYLADKANIFLYQKVDDVLILGSQVQEKIHNFYGGQIKSQTIVAPSDLPTGWQIKMLGQHNRYNASLALEVAKILDLDPVKTKETIENFPGVPGRLQFIREVEGVKYYNDTNATTPDATIAALSALKQYTGRVILIGGGADKELDFTDYARAVPSLVKELILFKGAATDKIKKILGPETKISEVSSMSEAMDIARGSAVVGDIILLSPGASSFGIFTNEYDRGDQFVELVENI